MVRDRKTVDAYRPAARMAKLVDAPGLGPDARKSVGVRVPLLAPVFSPELHMDAPQNPASLGLAGFCI